MAGTLYVNLKLETFSNVSTMDHVPLVAGRYIPLLREGCFCIFVESKTFVVLSFSIYLKNIT